MSEPKQKPATPPLPEPRSVPGVQVRKRYYFEVEFRYDPAVIMLFKQRVWGARWQAREKVWRVGEEDTQNLFEALPELARLVIERLPETRTETPETTTYLFPQEQHPQVGDLIQWPGRPANEVVTEVSPGPALSDDLLDEHGSHLWEWEGEHSVWVSVRPATHQERVDRTSVFVVGS
ncbi:MAG: hypothetical protein DI532_23460 [Azospirillum brasilense]|nr:MAG: hypothetical protein DI532_23460 [Azospirillum brasilense]